MSREPRTEADDLNEPVSLAGQAKLRAALDRLLAKSGYLTGCEQMNARLLATIDALEAASPVPAPTLDVDKQLLAMAMDIAMDTPTVEQSMSVAIHIERLAMAMHNVKGGAPTFGEAGECECREEAAAISDEYDRLGSERAYLQRLPWRP